MCGRYGRRADKQRIAEWFHTYNTDVFNDEYYEINSTRLAPSYNISPESIQPVVRLDLGLPGVLRENPQRQVHGDIGGRGRVGSGR